MDLAAAGSGHSARTSSSAHNIASVLARTAHCWPALPALATGDAVTHDYRAFAAAVAALAQGLRDQGVAPGERVAIVARNSTDYIVALFGAWWAGAVAVPVNAKLHPRELAFVLQNSGAAVVFVDERCAAGLTAAAGVLAPGVRVIVFGSLEHRVLNAAAPLEAPVPCTASDPAWLFYTSGTTGRPKGVIITHANLLAMALAYCTDVEHVAPGDALLHPAPLSHGSGLYTVPHVLGAAVNVVPVSGGFDAREIAALLRVWPRASFFAAPTMLKRLVESAAVGAREREHLKGIVYGGGPMYVEDCRAAFAALGPRLAQIYGQGESPMTITAMRRELIADAIARDDTLRLASVGVAQAGMEVRVAGADDAPLPTGAVGEVLVRGPAVMRGYWNDAAATAATLAGGWLHTGDLGALDEAGFLTLRDRSKDLIISGGANIYPREVEEVLLGHPGVAEVAVVGRPHADWGEEVVAFVVPRAGVAPDTLPQALDAHCLGSIARFKRPRAYRIIEDLPKNDTGKVLKTALRERLRAEASSPTGRVTS